MPRQPRIPSYRLHKPSGQAVVTLNGKDLYLGGHGSPESHEAYERAVAEWLANHRLDPAPSAPCRTVNEVLLAYLRFSETYYRKGGRLTKQYSRIVAALRPVRRLYGTTPARDFGPLALKAVRQVMVGEGWSRNYVNSCVGCVKRLWKWACSEELVPAEVYQRVRTVEGLRRGRSAARETKPVRPVPWAQVKPALPHMSRAVRAMVRLQLLTGMRPGEVVIFRMCDTDTSKPVWEYRPASYKTEHIGQERVVYLGPKAQAVIREFQRPDPEAYLFSPKDAQHLRKKHVNDRYSVDTYLQAVQYACDKADRQARRAAEQELAAAEGREPRRVPTRVPPADRLVPTFVPLQLRHTAATRIRKTYGIELARIILGHSTAFTTEIYAEADRGKAITVMGKIG
jgi:integrase